MSHGIPKPFTGELSDANQYENIFLPILSWQCQSEGSLNWLSHVIWRWLQPLLYNRQEAWCIYWSMGQGITDWHSLPPGTPPSCLLLAPLYIFQWTWLAFLRPKSDHVNSYLKSCNNITLRPEGSQTPHHGLKRPQYLPLPASPTSASLYYIVSTVPATLAALLFLKYGKPVPFSGLVLAIPFSGRVPAVPSAESILQHSSPNGSGLAFLLKCDLFRDTTFPLLYIGPGYSLPHYCMCDEKIATDRLRR